MQKRSKKRTKITVEFGDRMRKLRLSLNLTQYQLAERSNLDPDYLGCVERGEMNVSLNTILSIAKGLGCSAKQLMPD